MARQIDLALLLLQQLRPRRAVQPPPIRMTQDHEPLRAVERRPVLVVLLEVRRPDALLEDELLLLAAEVVLEDGDLGVRPLLVVVEEILAADAADGAGVRVDP